MTAPSSIRTPSPSLPFAETKDESPSPASSVDSPITVSPKAAVITGDVAKAFADARIQAKTSLAPEFAATEAKRAASKATYNTYGQIYMFAPVTGLVRAAVSVARIVANLFIATVNYLGSLSNCCGSLDTTATRRERAIHKMELVKDDLGEIVHGLMQAIPFFGAQAQQILSKGDNTKNIVFSVAKTKAPTFAEKRKAKFKAAHTIQTAYRAVLEKRLNKKAAV